MYIFVSCLTDSLYPCSHHSLRKVKNFIVGKLLLADYGKYRFFANNVLNFITTKTRLLVMFGPPERLTGNEKK